MYLGIHVSSSGGIENAIKNGKKYGVNTIQMMTNRPHEMGYQENRGGGNREIC